MRNRFKLSVAFLLILLLGVTILSAAGTLDIPWWTVDSGGGRISSGTLVIEGTIGQPDAGLMSGGTFELQGGFQVSKGEWSVYLPFLIS